MDYQPIFLIGAARSGTKILRDTISTHPDIAKVEYDINFIWKRYNENINHDELDEANIKSKFIKFINGYFSKKTKNKPYLIEKTVSNSLRIRFLLNTFPNAKFIILYRDGRDVVESVLRQWGKAPENRYLLKKLASVPIMQVLPFLTGYAIDTLKIKAGFSPRNNYIWGVQYKGWEKDIESDSILEISSKQWNYCINSTIRDKDKIRENNKIEIYYENLIEKPSKEFRRIANFLGLDEKKFNYDNIEAANVGKSKHYLLNDQYEEIENLLSSNLRKLGYQK